MCDVRFFPHATLGLWELFGVGASAHNRSDLISKALANEPQYDRAALVLDGIVQQSRDRLVLRSAGFQHNGVNSEQVRNVGPLASLPGVQVRAINQRIAESVSRAA